ncbi:hypothetical protein JAO71_09245 [Olleya sp. YSTF-M6]|uniref:Uncharacterized protein n=1 Tax=Olleya sediminilitoris TaxID=2795739 RepID=A0ABS1WLJ8_9FLAO|nr:hypothetical protein [Olleya sediminilitoris]MBL7559986.1 hypothetical protein [Olleya sediminilitoris]
MNTKSILNDTVKWWESKRLIYNIIVGLVGLITILIMQPIHFGFFECIGIIIWGIGANIFFSLGTLVEIFDLYYFKGKLKLHNYRPLFLTLGLFIACLITYTNVVSYYFYLF